MTLAEVIQGARAGRDQVLFGTPVDLEPLASQLLLDLVELREIRPIQARGCHLTLPNGAVIVLRYDGMPRPLPGRDLWRVLGPDVEAEPSR